MIKSIVAAGLVASALLSGFHAWAQDPPAEAPPPPPPAPPAPPPGPPPAPVAPPAGAQDPAPPPPAPPPPPVLAPPSGGFTPPGAGAPPIAPPAPPAGETPPLAQPPAPPPPAPPVPPTAGEKPEGEKDKDKEKGKDEVKDGVRVRGGFSVNGGVMFLPNLDAPTAGPSFGFAARIGVQINHYLGIVYQNTPIVTFTPQTSGSGIMQSGSFKAGFADYNSFLFMVTLGHFFDIGAGPSIDFLAVANGHASIMGQGIESSSGISPGAHARIAFNIGGLSGNGPRRSGFAIGADAHPLFTGAGKGLSLTVGLGAEWY